VRLLSALEAPPDATPARVLLDEVRSPHPVCAWLPLGVVRLFVEVTRFGTASPCAHDVLLLPFLRGVCPIHQRPAVTQVHDAIAVRADRLHAKLFEDAALDTDDKGPAYLEVDSWVRIVAFYLC